MYSRVDPVIDYAVRGLCRKPYHNHPKGCPNWGKDKCPPKLPKLEDFFDTSKPLYMIWNRFDIGKHIEKTRANHPDWTDYQLRCVLYWQGTARAQLKKNIEEFKKDHPDCVVTTGPEAMGVNITDTMKQFGIELEWPPTKYAYQCAMGGTQKENMVKSFESFNHIFRTHSYDRVQFLSI